MLLLVPCSVSVATVYDNAGEPGVSRKRAAIERDRERRRGGIDLIELNAARFYAARQKGDLFNRTMTLNRRLHIKIITGVTGLLSAKL